MARELTIQDILFRLNCSYTNTLTDGTVVTDPSGQTFNDSLATGTGADQADMYWHSVGRTISSGASEDIDMYDLDAIDVGAGAGRDTLGQAWVAAEIVVITVVNQSTSDGTLKVGGKSGTDCWNSMFDGDDDAKILVRPGGLFVLHAPTAEAYAVANTTNHELKMQAVDGDVTYDIFVVARSA